MNGIVINRNLSRSNSPLTGISELHWRNREEFFNQAEEAFSKEPSQSGVIQGQRKIHLGKRWFRCSYFPSRKNALGHLPSIMIPMESRLELAYALQLERNAQVRAYRCQAVKVTLSQKESYYPDFLMVDHQGQLHVAEIKADKYFLSERTRNRLRTAEALLKLYDVNFSILDASDLPSAVELENQQWLYSQIENFPSDQEIAYFRDKAIPDGSQHKFSFSQLQEIAQNLTLPQSLVPYLLFTGTLKTNWKQPINGQTGVWI